MTYWTDKTELITITTAYEPSAFVETKLPKLHARSLQGRRVQSLPAGHPNTSLLNHVSQQLIAPHPTPEVSPAPSPPIKPAPSSPLITPAWILSQMPLINQFFAKEAEHPLPPLRMRSPQAIAPSLEPHSPTSVVPTELSLEVMARPFIHGAKKCISDVYRVFRDGSISCLIEAFPFLKTADGSPIKDPMKIKEEFDILHKQAEQTHSLARLGVENIVEVFEVKTKEADGSCQIHFEMNSYKPDLYSMIVEASATAEKSGNPFDRTPFFRIVRDVAKALWQLHDLGYIHRDVKPENILTDCGRGKLTDFEFLLAIDVHTPMDPEGSPGYLPPEVFTHRDHLPPHPSYDCWDLGCVLNAILEVDLPFKDIQDRIIQKAIQSDTNDEEIRRFEEIIQETRDHVTKNWGEIGEMTAALLNSSPGGRPSAEAVYKALVRLIPD